jgi:hypothetical protein
MPSQTGIPSLEEEKALNEAQSTERTSAIKTLAQSIEAKVIKICLDYLATRGQSNVQVNRFHVYDAIKHESAETYDEWVEDEWHTQQSGGEEKSWYEAAHMERRQRIQIVDQIVEHEEIHEKPGEWKFFINRTPLGNHWDFENDNTKVKRGIDGFPYHDRRILYVALVRKVQTYLLWVGDREENTDQFLQVLQRETGISAKRIP